jgi:hypothetical protein
LFSGNVFFFFLMNTYDTLASNFILQISFYDKYHRSPRQDRFDCSRKNQILPLVSACTSERDVLGKGALVGKIVTFIYES